MSTTACKDGLAFDFWERLKGFSRLELVPGGTKLSFGSLRSPARLDLNKKGVPGCRMDCGRKGKCGFRVWRCQKKVKSGFEEHGKRSYPGVTTRSLRCTECATVECLLPLNTALGH